MSIGGEPYFRFWRITVLDNYGAGEVRIDDVELYGRSGGPDLVQYAIDREYTGGFNDGELVGFIEMQPSVTYEFEYPIAPRQIGIDYTEQQSWEITDPFAPVSGPAASNWDDVVYSPELDRFVAVGSGGTNYIMTSTDGITWTVRTPNRSMNAVVWAAPLGRFVAIGTPPSGARAIYSSDGITWNDGTGMSAATAGAALCYADDIGLFVSVGGGGGQRVATSTDGITWTMRNITINNWTGVARGLGIFAACSGAVTGSRIMTSTDGLTWAGVSTPAISLGSIAFSPLLERFVTVGDGGTGLYSDDGVTWNSMTVELGQTLGKVKWIDELALFIVPDKLVGSGYSWTSADGVTWQQLVIDPMGKTLDLNSVAYSTELHRLVFVGAIDPRIWYSDATSSVEGMDDAPRIVRVDVSNNNRDFFHWQTFENLTWS